MNIKEILLLHHSHLDVGYTHTQPIVWELQREFIDLALKLLDDTKNFPEHAKPKWTIEVTSQIMHWLKTASEEDANKIQKYINEGRVGISGFQYNTTPLANSESLIRQLQDIKFLREKFGIQIKTVNQHDVNGIPWTAVDLMLDAGIELFIMAVNRHLGGHVVTRPSIFRWRGPSGREILVMNGAHYTMFDQLLYSWENKVERMEEGLEEYKKHLKSIGYEEDFIYLTTAAAPVCWDNSPPTVDVAKLIKKWNALKKKPLIRYITPDELLEKIKTKPVEKYPVYEGDWTDYWNFGSASTAYQTKINRHAEVKAKKADFINSFRESSETFNRISKEVWNNITLFDEHTWGSYNSMDADNDFSKAQANIKDNFAYKAHELSDYLLVHQLEELAGNPENYDKQDGVLVVNPANTAREEYIRIPDWWFMKGKRRRTSRYGWPHRVEHLETAPLYGPIKIEPFSINKIKLSSLKKAVKKTYVKIGEFKVEKEGRHLNVLDTMHEEFVIKFLENDFYRIEFNPVNCRITRVFDKKNNWEVMPDDKYMFFQFVQETTDPLFKEERRAYYERELDKEKFDISCWHEDWERKRTTAFKAIKYELKTEVAYAELTIHYSAPGCKKFIQKYTLYANKSTIEINIEIDKEDIRTPESIYFVTKLNLDKSWECTFDTAGIPTKLDEEQLPGCSKDWFTVDKFVAMNDKKHCALLYCPDAPIIQAGGFNFGNRSKSIPRNENPLLVAWPLNNYWDTNFRPSQPGFISLKYYFETTAKFDETNIYNKAEEFTVPVEIHPLLKCKENENSSLITVNDTGLKIIYLKKSEDKKGIIVRLLSLKRNKQDFKLTLNGKVIKNSYIVSTNEEEISKCKHNRETVSLKIPYRRITNLYIEL